MLRIDDMQRQAVDLFLKMWYNASERSGLYGKKLLVDLCGTAYSYANKNRNFDTMTIKVTVLFLFPKSSLAQSFADFSQRVV